MSAALAVTGLRSGYGETEIVRGVTFSVRRGEAYALVGKNGAGKTTLLRTILRLLPASAGTIEVLGRDVSRAPAHRIAGRAVGYAPQEGALFADLSVADNLRLGALALDERAFRARRERVVELFPVLGQRLRQLAGTLSGGEQKMLNVARALMPEPEVLLLDEVSEGVQPSVVARIVDALAAVPTTILLVEQNIDFVLAVAGRYGLVERGELVGEGDVRAADAAATIERHVAI